MRKLFVLAAAVLFLAACAEIKPGPKPKDIPEISKTFIPELLAHRNVNGVKIKIYDTAALRVRGNEVSSLKSKDARLRLSVPAFLINHPKQGLILFDTGLAPETKTSRFEMRAGQDIVSQLRADSVNLESIRWVVLSHLHVDRAGMVGAFPNAAVLVDKREWMAQKVEQFQKRDARFVDVGALESRLKLRLVDLSTAPAYGSFDHGVDLFNDGTIILLDLSGHTAGTLGVWLNLDSGPVLLTGGAAAVLDNYQDLALPEEAMMREVPSYTRRLYQMRAVQEAVPQLVIFPGNDLAPLRMQPRDDVSLFSK